MRQPRSGSRRILLVIAGLVAIASISIDAQSKKPVVTPIKAPATPKTAAVPRLPDGHPDLQGLWDFAQLTPFERPGDLAGRESVSDEEAEELAQKRIETTHKDKRDGGAAADVERAYNDFWWDFGTRVSTQSSLVVDPPDGRIPPMTPGAQERIAQRRNRYDNPEERPLAERCILGFNSGPPMVPSAYNNNVQIVQTRDRLVVVNEMIHSARIVDLTGRPHQPKEIRFLTGDSVGRWEGDTLVVDTTNFSMEAGFRGASANLHLVERFTRVDADTLRYEFTVDDPATWTKKWSASIPMVKSNEQMFEYACHEANYALEGVLKGARYQEKHPPTQK
jgi:hypothetical protein